MIDLGTLGGTYSYGYGINASGQIAGTASTGGNAADGTMTDLGTLGGRQRGGHWSRLHQRQHSRTRLPL
jgi:probable HAF family extracellular repeat protein